MSTAISVIMPVYNSKDYIVTAIESILQQSFTDFELLLIDDGSSDGSQDICDQYAVKDSRVRVVHKKNGGICSARNVGLDIAKGEYIAFCDNDDKYLPGLLKDNYELAKKYKADLVRYNRYKIIIDEENKRQTSIINMGSKVLHFSSNSINNNYVFIRRLSRAIWTGLYRREFLKEHRIRFNSKCRYGLEDDIFNFKVYKFCKSLVVNPRIYYYWIKRDIHSTSNKTENNWLQTLRYCIKKDKEVFEEKTNQKKCSEWNKIIAEYVRFLYWYINKENNMKNMVIKIKHLKSFCEMPELQVKEDEEKKIGYLQEEMMILRCLKKKAYLRLFLYLSIHFKKY